MDTEYLKDRVQAMRTLHAGGNTTVLKFLLVYSVFQYFRYYFVNYRVQTHSITSSLADPGSGAFFLPLDPGWIKNQDPDWIRNSG
jgi:hypothetical protein